MTMTNDKADDRDIWTKIADGEYKPKVEIKPAVTMPPLLKKPAGDLTFDEIKQLQMVKVEYLGEVRGRKESWQKYRENESRLNALFWIDLHKEFGVPELDPFVGWMGLLAWEDGHAGGYGDVASAFCDMMPLWEMYKKKADELAAFTGKCCDCTLELT